MNLQPAPPADDISRDPERHGIVRVATEHFEVGGYRYSRLGDAVAEAARRRAAGQSS